MTVSEILRQAVVKRADNRCEYCRLSQLAQEATFHIDHIVPQSTGGITTMANLALACVTCSLRKGARHLLINSQTNQEISMFNPRRDRWDEHFRLNGAEINGLTAIGRATASTLQMNRDHAMAIRKEEQLRGRYPVV